MYLVFDAETTGLPRDWNAPVTDVNNWPRIVQIAWQLHDEFGKIISHQNFLVQPQNFNIPYEAEYIHGISTALAKDQGKEITEVLAAFEKDLLKTKFIVGQNINFDIKVLGCEMYRMAMDVDLEKFPVFDTCTEKTAELCKIQGGKGGKYKLPTLTELYDYLFKEKFAEAHNATADVEATTRCFFELLRQGHFSTELQENGSDYIERFQKENPEPIQLYGLKHLNLKKESEKLWVKTQDPRTVVDIAANKKILTAAPFVHLHNYSQFSVLQSTTKIPDLIKKTALYKMPAVALTDKANMMGAFKFIEETHAYNEKNNTNIKPIVGCELNVCEDHKNKKRKDDGYQIVMLAKNKKGYHNLAKMCSISHTEGFYYVPRIDKKIVCQYKKDIIVLTGNTFGEVPRKILSTGDKQAEAALLWWHEQFGEDLYIELIDHGLPEEAKVNTTLLAFSKKHNIKTVATNQTFYLESQDANAHDILLCVKDGEQQSTPKGIGRNKRYGLPNEAYYFKSPEEMKALFVKTPEAILNLQELVKKIESFSLSQEVLLPKFDVPQDFQIPNDTENKGQNDYLKELTYKGAEDRYGNIDETLQKRIAFELEVIKNTGYPGYFLIVEDFISKAREMGVSVGPGRGSVAGSVVAYCLKITNIDPIKYDLLFERFLNPERVSMPDIDIDFDDEGRDEVIAYVIEKYGEEKVAQIITYGTMAGKSAIRDTARVLDLPLHEANKVAKLVPINMNLSKILSWDNKKLRDESKNNNDFENVITLKKLSEQKNDTGKTIQQARILEGSIRNIGTHACGVIITPEDITNFVPVSIAKDTAMRVTQFDNSVVENAGLLKMDFLGLKTLSIIKTAVEIVKKRHNIDLDIDNISLDDPKTYALFQRGDTRGIFQYESGGMQKYMKDLKPTVFEDLVAMNALYRPGPLEYIPNFVKRKHGQEAITYDLPEMEEFLKETYGITVYQEQVMLLSQKLANFTKGQADVLRKAMGKKQIAVLKKMKSQFMKGATENGYAPKILQKIWNDWEAFAAYAFNKSHSVCYAYIGYQTAYLKAHYPAEYMAAILSSTKDVDKVSFFIQDCKQMDVEVLPPDINESYNDFFVNKQGNIRFGLSKIKGIGGLAADALIKEREKKPFSSVFDLLKRVDLTRFNKRVFEGLILSGALDNFKEIRRMQYFQKDSSDKTFVETLLKFAQDYKKNRDKMRSSLFGDNAEVGIKEPEIPNYSQEDSLHLEWLREEKEVLGRYLSAHPLDEFSRAVSYCNSDTVFFKNEKLEQLIGKTYYLAGIVTKAEHRTSKAGKGYGSFTLEDFQGEYEFRIFREDYTKFKTYLELENFIYICIKIEKGWWDRKTNQAGDPIIKFLNIAPLSDFFEKRYRGIEIQMALKNLNSTSIKELLTTFHQHEGKKQISFKIRDEQEKEEKFLRAKSRSTQVHISEALLEKLDQHKHFNFKLY